ncbi:MAG: putative photosynthetic complex assembly protein PuhE [Alphaproteobacteria bacterium]
MTYSEHVLPALAAILIWWLSTGVILLMNSLPRSTYPWSVLGMTCVTGVAVFGLAVTGEDTGTRGAYIAFLCSLMIWGWHEMTFLMGYITGSRKEPCPADAKGFTRFVYATKVLLHHEVALVFTGLGIAAVTWGDPNQTGLWTFVVLWAMRLSTKLNIFFGVPNITEEFLPHHMAFLKSYFRNRPMNAFFGPSVTLATIATVLVGTAALDPGLTAGEQVGLSLITCLMALGVLEHWFLVVPMREAALWTWAQPAAQTAGTGHSQAHERDAGSREGKRDAHHRREGGRCPLHYLGAALSPVPELVPAAVPVRGRHATSRVTEPRESGVSFTKTQ